MDLYLFSQLKTNLSHFGMYLNFSLLKKVPTPRHQDIQTGRLSTDSKLSLEKPKYLEIEPLDCLIKDLGSS